MNLRWSILLRKLTGLKLFLNYHLFQINQVRDPTTLCHPANVQKILLLIEYKSVTFQLQIKIWTINFLDWSTKAIRPHHKKTHERQEIIHGFCKSKSIKLSETNWCKNILKMLQLYTNDVTMLLKTGRRLNIFLLIAA